jgi:quinol monooxygenase YgiN
MLSPSKRRWFGKEVAVIVVRFKLRCSPDKTEEVEGLLAAVQSASQAVSGVITFDIGRDLLDENAFIATEVFDDRAALDRQEALPEVAAAMAAFDGALVEPPEATIYHVGSSEPYE